MTAIDLIAALPLIVPSASAVIVMLAIAIRRHHGIAAVLTLAGLALTLATLPFVPVPFPLTPLLVIDGYARFYAGVFTAAAFATALLSYGYLAARPNLPREEYYVLLLLATLGAIVLVSARHLAALFLGLELLSVPLYALIAYNTLEARALEAGLKYLILAGVSSAFLLFGMALVYADLGTLEFVRVGTLLAQSAVQPVYFLAGVALVVAGAAFKLSLVPFHLWTPDVFEGAPAPVGGFLASVSKGAMLALLVRLFADANVLRYSSLVTAIALIAIASMLAGNLLALRQDNLKRLLAYSSIAHLGYLLVAFLVGGALGIEALTYYVVAYIVMNLAAFGVLTVLSQGQAQDLDRLQDVRGLFWHRPWLAAAFTAALLSLAGIPLTIGFIAKFYVLVAGVDAALWLLVAAVILGSAIGLYYYVRVTVTLFLTTDRSALPVRISWPDSLALAALTFLIMALGIYPAPLIRFIQTTALHLV